MRKIRFMVLIMFLWSEIGYSQINFEEKLSIFNVTIQQDLVRFCNKSTDFKNEQSIVEILPHYCAENSVSFKKNSTYVDISIKEEKNEKILDKVSVVTHSHYRVEIDDSELKDVVGVNFYSRGEDEREAKNHWCKFLSFFSKNICKHRTYFSSPYYKMFYSKDHRRFYIYLLLSQESQSEMIWIFEDDKYVGRIINNLTNK